MFGSEIAAEFVYAVLVANQAGVTIAQPDSGVLAAARTAVAAAVGGRVENLSTASGTLPAAIHYAEDGPYGGPVDSDVPVNEEQLRYVVRFVCEGKSTDPIRLAATRALQALQGAEGVVTYDGVPYAVTVMAGGEFVIPLPPEGGVFYRQLGNYYQVDITRGG